MNPNLRSKHHIGPVSSGLDNQAFQGRIRQAPPQQVPRSQTLDRSRPDFKPLEVTPEMLSNARSVPVPVRVVREEPAQIAYVPSPEPVFVVAPTPSPGYQPQPVVQPQAHPVTSPSNFDIPWQQNENSVIQQPASFPPTTSQFAANSAQTPKKVQFKKHQFSVTLPHIDVRGFGFMSQFSPAQTRFVVILFVALAASVTFNFTRGSSTPQDITNLVASSQASPSQGNSSATPLTQRTDSTQSTTKQSGIAVGTSASSNVVADTPQTLTINKLNINANVEMVGINSNNLPNSPSNNLDAGWLNVSSKPGAAGAVLMNGSGAAGGVFAKLGTLAIGDEIRLTRSDGVTFTYKIAKVQSLPAGDSLDMADLLGSAQPGTPGLNLVSYNSGKAGRTVVKAIE